MDRRHLLSDQDEPTAGPAYHHPAAPTAGQWTGAGAEATAPPTEDMPTVPGYENLGPGYNDVPPPPGGYQHPQPPASTPTRHWDIPAISEELAREAFTDYATSSCCYSSKPPKEMVLTDLQALNTYRYRLETFTESRSTEWASEPYNGQLVDGMSGVAPGPWDVAVSVPTLFLDSEMDIRIPHTASIKGCHSCLNLGKSACTRCVASGRIQCEMCGGSGADTSHQRCCSCNGLGRVKCRDCSGVGSNTCATCQGRGQLLCYVKLKIKWTNNIYVQVMDKRSGFPVDLLDSVAGETLLADMNVLVYPVSSFPDEAVNTASRKAVQEHQAQFSTTCRILQQRQTVELIPVTRVHYAWKEKTHIFFVYGIEHKVFTKDYPAKCICCTIS
ncbi:ssu-2 homolog, tandem duplicate 2 [Pygocentrus nattereri]|uniref:Ssu-2 homolog, tandem duplicate 2 n=1 Tax=Pygocentrus nattereri TaxID=42514 RepID=A0A3B4D5A7_PYGNA|nr:ssu-2 homolog, tandem duplicate 2 [Pygocentrus nattereri]